LERESELGEREPWEGEGRESLRETKRPKTDSEVSFGKCLLDMQKKDKRKVFSNV
jgi:hypothetical protein